MSSRKLAIVTGASSGIGLEIAKLAAKDGYDLIVAADTPFVEAGPALKEFGVDVQQIEVDLATQQGLDQLLSAVASAESTCSWPMPGHGLGHAFLDQSPKEWQHVIDTNITGTLLLIQPIVQRMVERGEGKVLITGSIAGHLAGAFQAVYNGSKAFIDSFSAALNEELKRQRRHGHLPQAGRDGNRVLPSRRARRHKVGQAEKDDPADVAKSGWEAMKKGRAGRHLWS